MILRPDVPMIKPVKMHSNVGACIDIPTGVFVKGKYGENLLKGGVPGFFGISGKANNFKSTILAWMLLTALYRLTKHAASLSWYDTEVNVELTRLAFLASNIEGYERFTEENGTVFDAGLWVFSDKGNMHTNIQCLNSIPSYIRIGNRSESKRINKGTTKEISFRRFVERSTLCVWIIIS
jgi:hypothetical protein